MGMLLYLTDDFEGGETRLYPGGESPSVAIQPVTGSALIFGQSFKLGRAGVAHSADAMLHEGLPVTSTASRPFPLLPAAKYILRTDVQFSMPTPTAPVATAPASQETAMRDLEGSLKN